MRDGIVVGMVILAALIALRRPWIGVLLWCWLSLMNPHRYTFGFAYNAPLAAIAALSILLGLVMTKDRESPFKGTPVALLVALMVWVTLSWRMGLDPADDYEQWDKVMKVDLMVVVALALMRTKQHIFGLMWVCAASIALLGAKGGVFTIMSGGSYKVWGPSGSFIADNNHFALAVVMTIPLVGFLRTQMDKKWMRLLAALVMLLLAACALGSHSRGGLLALCGMGVVLWWRGRKRFAGGVAILLIGAVLITFMPDNWTERMSSIQTYDEDRSAMGRFSAWWVSWRIGFNYPFGVGFNISRPELFAAYSPYPELGTPVAHSIYFQVLGNHGFGGLFLFLGIWFTTLFYAQKVRKAAKGIPQAQWCVDLAGMCQVSIIGYLVGGTFLNLAYFDLPYYVMAAVVLTHQWVTRKAWLTEPVYQKRWFSMPGLASSTPSR